jgi:peptidoglycan/LPS O-acetylase OafA/YrhL
MNYRREIDGIRALAVIPVILFHAGFSWFSGGYVGVDVFFVISGYLITGIVTSDIARGTFSIANFYERRIRRILPALFLVVVVCAPVAFWVLLPADLKEFGQSLIAVATFSSNVFFWSQSGYFHGAAELKPLLHTWSLSVEEQFYVVFPPLLLLMWRWGRKWVVTVLLAIAMTSLLLAEWGALNKPIATFFLLPTRAWELLLGSLAAFYIANESRQQLTLTQNNILASIGFIAVAYAVFGFDAKTTFPGLHALVPTLGTALMIISARPETWVGKFLCQPAMVSVGLISYSAYLWHQPLFSFARHLGLTDSATLTLGALAVLSLVLGYLSWRYVETPFRRNRVISRNRIFLFAGCGSLAILLTGLSGHMLNGFIDRLNPEDRYLASISSGEQGVYVRTRFDALHHASFSEQDKGIKLMVIGDSYAKDLVNAIYEGPLANQMQVSTHQISAGCGNLFLTRSIEAHVTNSYPVLCRQDGWYNSSTVRELIRQSDQVWVASAWQAWDAALLPESLANLRREFGDKFVIFGTKDFGIIDIKKLLATPVPQRYQTQNQISETSRQINRQLAQAVGTTHFVDVSDLICGASGRGCRVFTPDGRLLSYDGGHLTVEGARELGSSLVDVPAIKNALSF